MLMSVRDTHNHRLFCVSSNLLQVQLATIYLMQYALILMTRNCMANALISSYAKIMSISNLLSKNSVHLYA